MGRPNICPAQGEGTSGKDSSKDKGHADCTLFDVYLARRVKDYPRVPHHLTILCVGSFVLFGLSIAKYITAGKAIPHNAAHCGTEILSCSTKTLVW